MVGLIRRLLFEEDGVEILEFVLIAFVLVLTAALTLNALATSATGALNQVVALFGS